MKYMTNCIVLASISAALMIAPTSAFAQQDEDIQVPGSVADYIPLGTAYNSFENRFLNLQTVEGTAVPGTDSASNVVEKEDLGYRAVASLLSGKLQVEAGFQVADVSAGGHVALASASDSLSKTWVLSAVRRQGTVTLRDPVLTTQGGQINSQNLDTAGRLKQAGDGFVSGIVYGTYMFVSMKVEFANDSEAFELGGEINASFANAEISGEFETQSQERKEAATITIRAQQFGGNPIDLLRILPHNVVQCNLANLQPCKDAWRRAIRYAKGTDKTYNANNPDPDPDLANVVPFHQQSYERNKANVVEYIVTPYKALSSNASGLKIEPADLEDHSDADQLLYDLETDYVKALEDHRRASSLLRHSLKHLSPQQRVQAREISRATRETAAVVKDLMNYCKSNIFGDDCRNFIATNCSGAPGNGACYVAYDLNSIDIPEDFLFQDKLEDYKELVKGGSANTIGDILLGSNSVDFRLESTWATGPTATYDANTGRLQGYYGIKLSDKHNPTRITGSFLAKTDQKMNYATIRGNAGVRILVKVWDGDQWIVGQRHVLTDAAAYYSAAPVDGYYYYLFEFENGQGVDFGFFGGNANNPANIYLYKKP